MCQMRHFYWAQEVVELLQNEGLSADAQAMSAYVKGKFSFLGLKKTPRAALTKPLFERANLPSKVELQSNCEALWALPEREYQMVALDLIRKFERQLTPEDLPWIKALILKKSWWDSVDFLATHAVGSLLERYPTQIRPELEIWIRDPNMWLNRSAIIAQILYRKNLDVIYLTAAILPHMHSKEFFLRKAIGWALRSHAARDPQWVLDFVEAHRAELSGLSIREALKHFR